MTTFLVATDGSPASRHAVEVGVELAKSCDGAVVFVYVAPAPDAVPTNGFGVAGAVASEPSGPEQQLLASAQGVAEEHGVRSRSMLLRGDPVHEIAAYADDIRADVTIVGSRRLGPLLRGLFGSVSRELLTVSKRPVVVVPARF